MEAVSVKLFGNHNAPGEGVNGSFSGQWQRNLGLPCFALLRLLLARLEKLE
jgi:hypothetical protein